MKICNRILKLDYQFLSIGRASGATCGVKSTSAGQAVLANHALTRIAAPSSLNAHVSWRGIAGAVHRVNHWTAGNASLVITLGWGLGPCGESKGQQQCDYNNGPREAVKAMCTHEGLI